VKKKKNVKEITSPFFFRLQKKISTKKDIHLRSQYAKKKKKKKKKLIITCMTPKKKTHTPPQRKKKEYQYESRCLIPFYFF
jgi:hypothetical protein